MEYQLQLNPFVRKDGWKYKVIQITDITLHTSHHEQPASIGKKIVQAFKSMRPGRIYSPISYARPNDSSTDKRRAFVDLLKKDPAFVKMIREEEQNGCKVLIGLPKEIPILMGRDTVEFLASVNGKRVLRGLAKNSQQS